MNTDSIIFWYLIKTLIVLAVAFVLAKIIRIILTRMVRAASLTLKVDPTKYNFIKNAASFIIFIAALIVIFHIIPPLRTYGVTLFAGAGVLAAIVGFASQSAFSNIISGIFIVIFKPFRVTDHVNISNSYTGQVEDITLRHTVIRSYDNRRIVIPNSIISNETIINSSLVEDKTCIFIPIGISYDSDVDLAINIIQEEAIKHRHFLDNRTAEDKQDGDPAVVVRLLDYGDSSINLRASVWANDPISGFEMKCDLYKSIKKRFDAEGVEIPFPHRTIVYKEKKNGHAKS